MKKTIILIIICILLVAFGLRIRNDWNRYRLLKQEAAELSLKNKTLTEEQEKLERLKESGSRQEVLEEEVRVMLGFKKEGEHVVLVLPINEKNPNLNTTTSETQTNHLESLIAQISKFWYNLKALFLHH
ncbi:MAG: hypothetical protein GYA31_01485 [Parcubacteria group bacterium]|nr:hypothetical protein [Parcubacteria group bacterium]